MAMGQMMFQENKVALWEAEYTLVEIRNFAGLFPQEMTFAGRGTQRAIAC